MARVIQFLIRLLCVIVPPASRLLDDGHGGPFKMRARLLLRTVAVSQRINQWKS